LIPNKTYMTINRSIGKALRKYGMIADGDRILVGLSGGKDRLVGSEKVFIYQNILANILLI